MRRKNKTKVPLKGVPPDDPEPDQRVKGMIPYPCCPNESVLVYAEARGRSSIKITLVEAVIIPNQNLKCFTRFG